MTRKKQKKSDFFTSVFTNEVEGVWELANKPDMKHKLVIRINEEVVSKNLPSLRWQNLPAQMHPRTLHEIRSIIVTPLTLLYQTSLQTGVLPAAWKKANITAIHKKGSKRVAGNYRPVSLINIICKVMESIVGDALVKYMKDSLLFTDRQFGFLGGRSTTLQLLKVLDDWTEVLDSGSYVDMVYCDFMKAFDTVLHGRLIQVIEY